MFNNIIKNYKPIFKNKNQINTIEERHYLLDCYKLITTTNKNHLNLQFPLIIYIIKKVCFFF